MKKIILILVLFTIISQSCGNDDDCRDCFTPPQSFIFEIIDKTTGENLFTNETYEAEQIQITNTLNDSPVEFTFISENDVNLIQIDAIGWQTEIVNLKIDILDNHIFNFYVDAERKMVNCCNSTEYNEITIGGSEFELNAQTGIYKILVE